jgi:hypothetical protein
MAEDVPETEPGDVAGLIARSQLLLVGTVQSAGSAAVPGSVLVHVDEVLRAPQVLSRLAGQSILLVTQPPVPDLASTWGFLVDLVELGAQVSGHEVGRLPTEQLRSAIDETGSASAEPAPTAVIVGRVLDVQKVDQPAAVTEHDPDWFRATVAVDHVEDGAVEGSQVAVVFSNSQDVQWAASPKLRAAQEVVLRLHPTDQALAAVAPYRVTEQGDVQPVAGTE